MPTEESLPPDSPSVSAVIVSRNRAGALRQTLAALLPPGFPAPPEVVVVDAGSRDGSAEIDEEFPAVRLVKMPRNFGRVRARNIGMRTATGEFVLLLEPGVILQASDIQKLVDALTADGRAAAAAPRLVNAQNEPEPQAFSLPDAAALAEACRAVADLPAAPAGERAEAVWPGALLLRKSYLAGMNYFDEKRYGDTFAELDLFRKMRDAGRDVIIPSQVIARRLEAPPDPSDPGSRALLACDRIAGAAAYVRKHDGILAGISFQIKMFFGALAALFRPSEAGHAWRVLTGMLSGVKIDGSHDGPLA